MEVTNTGDLSVEAPRVYKEVPDGTYQAVYKGFKPYKEDGLWGHKEGVRLHFNITKGPFKDEFVTFKGAYFQNRDTGGYSIGNKSKLADAIRNVTGGEKLNAGHVGTNVLIVVTSTIAGPKSKEPGKRWANVTSIIPLPKDDVEAPQTTQASATSQTMPPVQPATPPVKAAPAPVQAQTKNTDLLDGLDSLDDLSDLG